MNEAAPNPDCPGCQALLKRVERLERELRELRALLDRNSSNSNKPPSSDSPAQRGDRPARPSSGKQPGGQPGHEVHQRALLPAEQVTRLERRDPRRCRRCSASLALAEELEPLRHQVIEIPRIVPDVTEYVLGRRCCTICMTVTAAQLPKGTPRGMCGPRLMALIALLTGAYHLSRRNTATLLGDVLGVTLSLGTVSNVESNVSDALAPAHAEALARVRQAKVKNLDATSWAQAGEPRSLWTFASRLATVFVITMAATTDVVRELVGSVRGTLVTDRGSQFGFWAMDQRQICWAHPPPRERVLPWSVGLARSGRGEHEQRRCAAMFRRPSSHATSSPARRCFAWEPEPSSASGALADGRARDDHPIAMSAATHTAS